MPNVYFLLHHNITEAMMENFSRGFVLQEFTVRRNTLAAQTLCNSTKFP